MIADFGLSRVMDDEKFKALTEVCGTPGVRLPISLSPLAPHLTLATQYMAPEIFKKSNSSKPWGPFRSSTNASWQLDTANPLMSGRWVLSPTSSFVDILHSIVTPNKKRWKPLLPVTTNSSLVCSM